MEVISRLLKIRLSKVKIGTMILMLVCISMTSILLQIFLSDGNSVLIHSKSQVLRISPQSLIYTNINANRSPIEVVNEKQKYQNWIQNEIHYKKHNQNYTAANESEGNLQRNADVMEKSLKHVNKSETLENHIFGKISKSNDTVDGYVRKAKNRTRIRENQIYRHKWKPYIPSMYPQEMDLRNVIDGYLQGEALPDPQYNEYSYTPIINPIQKCVINRKSNERLLVLFIVKTSPENFNRRNTLRQTWANENNIPNIRTVFSIGLPMDTKIMERIKLESLQYRDILLRNFIDTYNNLTLKTISSINWAVTYCSVANYVISVDDDMFVGTYPLMEYLRELSPSESQKLYAGHVIRNVKPVRNDTKKKLHRKWIMFEEEYPYARYPDYVFGGFIVMSMQTVKDMSLAIPFTKPIKIEDAYIGIVSSRLGILPKSVRFTFDTLRFTDVKYFKSIIASHHYNSEMIRNAWNCHLYFYNITVENIGYCKFEMARMKSNANKQ